MDNRYHKYNCPGLMSDGRFISNYTRSSTFDQYIRKENNIKSSHEFRHFLQENGSTILNNLKAYHRQNNTCSVQGRCLPMSGQNNENIINESRKQLVNTIDNWFNNVVQDNEEDLTFMMTSHNIDFDAVSGETDAVSGETDERTPEVPSPSVETAQPKGCNFCKV